MMNYELENTLSESIKSINLHIHSKFSDGILKPKEIISISGLKNIDIISLTDHDTVSAYNHLTHSKHNVKILPGIEISSYWKGEDVHVLGYGIDVKYKPLLEILNWMKDGRHSRAEKMIEKLTLLGIKIPLENVLAFTGDMNLIVRPHIAQALVAKKYCKNKQDAFERYIGNDAPAYVPKPGLKTPDVISLIHDAGGIAIIAHPGKLKSKKTLDEFVEHKVDGLEVCHPYHNLPLVRELEMYCVENKLLQTGGSDYHGEEKGYNSLSASLITESVLRDVQMIWDNFQNSR